jgi:signal transduction histidine kinase
LAIAQGIVEEHGGEITVDSVPSRKTTFTVSWPLSGA